MSFKAVDWAASQRIPCFQKMVLLMLANRHNGDTGRCDPSHDMLVDDCGMSRRAVIDQIEKLQKLGLISVINRAKDGLKTSNSYRLHLHVMVKPDVQEVHNDVQEVHEGSATVAHGVVQELHINQEVEPVNEPVSIGRKRPTRRTQLPDDFIPNETGQTAAAAKGINLMTELQKFTDFHLSKGNVMADWQAAWRTWVGNARPQQQFQSFAERDAAAARKRWEEMTGEIHPENRQHSIVNVIEPLRISQ